MPQSYWIASTNSCSPKSFCATAFNLQAEYFARYEYFPNFIISLPQSASLAYSSVFIACLPIKIRNQKYGRYLIHFLLLGYSWNTRLRYNNLHRWRLTFIHSCSYTTFFLSLSQSVFSQTWKKFFDWLYLSTLLPFAFLLLSTSMGSMEHPIV